MRPTCLSWCLALALVATVRAQTDEEPAPVAEEPAPAAAPAAPAAPANPLVADLNTILAILEAKQITVDPAAARRAVYECIARTTDPEARLMSTQEYDHLREEQQGLDYHLGIRLTMSNATPCIHAIDSERPDLRVGDLIVAVGNRAMTNLTLVQASRLLRGHTNETLQLTLLRPGAGLTTVSVTSALSPVRAIEVAEKLPQNIAYLKLNGLYKDAGRELVSVLRGWAETGRFGFVLDLRGADGDDLASVIPAASLFATGGSLLYALRDLDDQDLNVAKASEGDPLDTPVMVLVDERTAGAAEVLAAALSDSVRGALLLGTPTGGDAMVREALPLPQGELLYITTRRLVTADGEVYAGSVRVQPDIVVDPRTPDGPDFEHEAGPDRREVLEVELGDRALRDRIRGDAALKRAIDVLLGLKALNIRAGGVSSR